MKLLSLGHSSFLLEMTAGDGELVRILGDPWLSDYAIGDLMGRFPRVELDYAAMPEIHGIFISHSHTDHLDPYSLLELWDKLPNRPVLILPQSIEYLSGMLEEYLDDATIMILDEGSTQDFFGLGVTGLFNLEKNPTNEDDVMILVVENGEEIFFSESDACLPFYDQEAREAISAYLGGDGEGIGTAVFLTIKNELDATMASMLARDLAERATYVAAAEDATLADVNRIYAEMPASFPDLWQSDVLVRLIGGQGLCFPQSVNPEWNRVLFPISLADRVDVEREVRDELDYAHEIEEFEPGMVHVLEEGEMVDRYDCPFLTLKDDEDDRLFDPELELFEDFPLAPLRLDIRDREQQEQKILETLNHRFLPYLIGRHDPSIQVLLASNENSYVVRVRYGNPAEWEDKDYVISFGQLRFELADETGGLPDEFYWANDLEDYLQGHCDDFSTFCRHLGDANARRLWDCLGMPFLNDDLVEKKHRYHFERAKNGETVEDFVIPYYKVLEELDPRDDDEDLVDVDLESLDTNALGLHSDSDDPDADDNDSDDSDSEDSDDE